MELSIIIPKVIMAGKIEELYSQNLAKHFSSFNAEIIGGLCSILVGVAMVTGA